MVDASGGLQIRLAGATSIRVELTEPLYKGMSGDFAVGQLLQSDDGVWEPASPAIEYEIYPTFWCGYGYEGLQIKASLDDGLWYADGSGIFFSGGDSADVAINPGSTGTLTIRTGEEVEVTAIDQIRSGKRFAVWWDDEEHKWFGWGAC